MTDIWNVDSGFCFKFIVFKLIFRASLLWLFATCSRQSILGEPHSSNLPGPLRLSLWLRPSGWLWRIDSDCETFKQNGSKSTAMLCGEMWRLAFLFFVSALSLLQDIPSAQNVAKRRYSYAKSVTGSPFPSSISLRSSLQLVSSSSFPPVSSRPLVDHRYELSVAGIL